MKNIELFTEVDWAQFSLGIDVNINCCYAYLMIGPISIIFQWEGWDDV